VDLKHANPALLAGEKGGPIEYIDAPEGVIAFSRAVDGNKVIVAANFGVAAPVIPSEAKESEATSNRPAAETAGTPFLNLASAPVSIDIPLDGEYTDWFTGVKVSGTLTATLAPGEYVVLTK
jgi:hypothetical protein